MWREYFKLIRLKPGRVITHLCGEIDFSKDNLPLDVLKKLYENDFPYLEITEFGKQKLYGIRAVTGDIPVTEAVIKRNKSGRRKQREE